jgi:hypothetical protein
MIRLGGFGGTGSVKLEGHFLGKEMGVALARIINGLVISRN